MREELAAKLHPDRFTAMSAKLASPSLLHAPAPDHVAPVLVDARSLAAGLSNDPIGTHTGKTLMLAELRRLLAAVPEGATYDDFRRATAEENALEKSTAANRLNTLMYVKQLYGLDRRLPVFAALEALWRVSTEAQPQLALLCALARDVLLRTASPAVLDADIGARVSPADIAARIRAAFPDRYSAASLRNLGSNMASSWTQAGYLAGKQAKHRIRPETHYPAVVYAIYLGHLEGHTGPALFTTYWARALDSDEPSLRHQAEVAARSGWLEYRSGGGMTAITFQHLDQLTGWERHQDG